MNTVTLGFRNAFRNGVRSASIIIILGLSIGLCLVMLIAHQAVGQKINQVKSSVGNTITITPAGFQQGASANNALTTSQLGQVKNLPHVTNVTETLTDRESTTGSSTPSFGGFGGNNQSSTTTYTTSLSSPVTLNTNGPRFFAGGGNSGSGPATGFSLPISFLGTTDPSIISGTSITIKSGQTLNATSDTNEALISSAMASKNNLGVGSTFTAYNATLSVAGIFTSSGSNQDVNNTVVLSLSTLQRLDGQSGDVTSAVATVDSLDNLSSTTNSIKNLLGSNADVVSAQDEADSTVQPLQNVQKISLISLIGAIIAGAVIILLVMIMIVRERRREIGILKAIGASNLRVILQFISEAVTLTIAGAVIGIIIGVVGGSPVTNTLVSNSSNSSNATTASLMPAGQRRFGGGGSGGPGAGANFRRPTGGFVGRGAGNVRNTLSNIHANIGWSILGYGLAAAIVIAIIGSSLAGWLIAKVRPSEVMRAE